MELIPFFQPIVDVWKQHRLGYEALIRGRSNGHSVSAQQLFERAKETKSIKTLDFQARERSIQKGLHQLKEGERLFLNISSQAFSDTDPWFPDNVSVEKITLEITEQTPIYATPIAYERLEIFRSQGMQLALDDFGVGFTNLSLIGKLRPDFIKLDREFARRIGSLDVNQVVKGIVRLCDESQVRLIVEGVETYDQKERLLDMGVRYMQGFYFGYPDPVIAKV